MKDLQDKVAVITGGGSGIGRGMAHAFADAGMRIVVADIERAAAESVADEVRAYGVTALAAHTDVADRASVDALAAHAYAEMGAVHLLCNNAGVVVVGPLDAMTDDDWRWVLHVNLGGVINGLQAFLPRLREQSGAKHIVTTASMAGLFATPGLGVYTATKYALVGLSETLRADLAPHHIGVSVLCPGLVATRGATSERNRQAEFGGPEASRARVAPAADSADLAARYGMDPMRVGRIVRAGVLANDLYIFTHPEHANLVENRFRSIAQAFTAAPEQGE